LLIINTSLAPLENTFCLGHCLFCAFPVRDADESLYSPSHETAFRPLILQLGNSPPHQALFFFAVLLVCFFLTVSLHLCLPHHTQSLYSKAFLNNMKFYADMVVLSSA